MKHRDDEPQPPWRHRPRYPLNLIQEPHLAIAGGFIIFALIVGGAYTVVGFVEGSQLLGLVALAGGVAALVLVVLYVRRPVRPRRPEPRLRDELKAVVQLVRSRRRR